MLLKTHIDDMVLKNLVIPRRLTSQKQVLFVNCLFKEAYLTLYGDHVELS